MTTEEIASVLDPLTDGFGSTYVSKRDSTTLNDIWKKKLIDSMSNLEVKTHATEKYQVTYIKPTEYYGLDVTAIRNNEPEIYEKYKVLRTASARLALTCLEDLTNDTDASEE